jgi:hypothetical protein
VIVVLAEDVREKGGAASVSNNIWWNYKTYPLSGLEYLEC